MSVIGVSVIIIVMVVLVMIVSVIIVVMVIVTIERVIVAVHLVDGGWHRGHWYRRLGNSGRIISCNGDGFVTAAAAGTQTE